jgi:outer membrane protein assembly factor BamB
MTKHRLLIGSAFLLVASLVAGTTTVRADDWPQWRGPQRNGVSQETGLLRAWPAGGPKLLWQRSDIGEGYATPAVVGSRLYLLANRGLDDEFVAALGVEDGKQVWSTRIGKVGNPEQQPPFPMARSTPTVDGDWLYALGSDGDLACLATAGGKVRWHKSLRSEFGGRPGKWAYAESPLVDGDVLVCTPGGGTATLAALDKKSGAVLWKSAVPGGEEAAYASVTVVVALVEAAPDACRRKGQFTPPGQPRHTHGAMEKAWPYPVVANGRLYIRDQNVLWCYDVKAAP